MKEKKGRDAVVMLPEKVFSLQLLAVLRIEWKTEEVGKQAKNRPFHALSYRFSGTGHYKYNGKELDVEPGQLIFVPKGISYEIDHSPSELIVIHFDCDVPLGNGEIEVCKLHDKFPFHNFFNEIYQSWRGQQPGGTYRAAALLYDFLGGLCAEQMAHSTPTSAERLMDTVAYMRRNFSDPMLTVPELARHFGTSEVYFRRMFEETMGTSPLKYIRDLRLEYARELLETGYYSVNETAERCGFTDAKYFSRLMKKSTGKKPSDFKLD